MEKLLINSLQVIEHYSFEDNIDFKKLICDLLDNENLHLFCNKIELCSIGYGFSYYDYFDKSISIDINKIYYSYKNMGFSNKEINFLILRIIYHEITHIYQFYMIENNLQFSDIFIKEINTHTLINPIFLPREVNADIYSSIILLNQIQDKKIYNIQKIWTKNLINSKFINNNPVDLIDYKTNESLSDFNKMIYGINLNYNYVKKLF